MLLHSGGTRRLLNPAQRQPESNLLLEPAKQNRHIFSAPISRRKDFSADMPERKPYCFFWQRQSLLSPPKIFSRSAQSHPAQQINSE